METATLRGNSYLKTVEDEFFVRFEQEIFSDPTGLVYETDLQEFDEESEVFTQYLGLVDLDRLVQVVTEHGKENPNYGLGIMNQSYYWLVRMPDNTFYPFPLLFETAEVRNLSAEEAGKPAPSDEDIQLVFTEILKSAIWP